MSDLFMFEKPVGFRDTLPKMVDAKNNVRSVLQREITRWGYQFIETPTVEYFETVGSASAISDHQLFKLLDHQGHTLVLRPDMTTPIARLSASKMRSDHPQRLAYSTNVFRAQQKEGGRLAEFEQIGVELIGDESVSADAEVIALMVTALKDAGIHDFQVSIGHMGFLHAVFYQILGTTERVEKATTFLLEKNYVGYREHVASLTLSSIDKQRLYDFLQLRGTTQLMEDATAIMEQNEGNNALEQLRKLWETLVDYGVQDVIKFDLSLVSHMSYYSGILFEVYTDRVGFPIGNGGRYDTLLKKFGNPTEATGFALRLDSLVEAAGTLANTTSPICVLFSEEQRAAAISLANEKRSEGHSVILQDIQGVKEMDAFTAQYDEIVVLVGKSGGRK
ncbi:ATP phosphoribosyltransferase regulatory subunit [Paenisporosarcina cavernae]|uniref:ATP phosphoribosyltransferase regulatory subunit n=1 Tax=Paenisporosarcina cavernae TaxID=2320858 RepID=A0A385YP48_9BACL|nr:ATP phosphoribosyltransferase regulatory subunit [Paenisporosarcina cavernae]AYC28449.1 ATP phosphoribosyltransferase regulatory subunit [Paenisporosarcina cavernae]